MTMAVCESAAPLAQLRKTYNLVAYEGVYQACRYIP